MDHWLHKFETGEQFTKDDVKNFLGEIRQKYAFKDFTGLPDNTQVDYAKKARRVLEQRTTPSKYCRQKGLKRSTYHA